MSKSFISSPVVSTPLATVNLPTASGKRLVAVGKQGPVFEQPTPRCGDCRDFQQVMVRRGDRLQAVTCQCASTGTGDDLLARIPTGAPESYVAPAVSA